MKNLLNMTILTVAITFTPLTLFAGGGGPGGGSYVNLLRYHGFSHVIYMNRPVTFKSYKEYQNEFFKSFYDGMDKLEELVKKGNKFKDRAGHQVDFTLKHIFEAKKIAESIRSPRPFEQRFRVEYGLQDAPTMTHESPLTAKNSLEDLNGVVTFNPVQWENISAIIDLPINVRAIKEAIAVHEVISLLGIERTNYYPVSSALLDDNLIGYNTDIYHLQEQIIVEAATKFLSLRAKKELEYETPVSDIDIFWFQDLPNFYDENAANILDWDKVERVLETTCKQKPGFKSIKCYSDAMMAVAFGDVPKFEKDLQTLVATQEDKLGLFCKVDNIRLENAETFPLTQIWNLEMKCQTRTHYKLKQGLRVRIGSSTKIEIDAPVEVNEPIYFEPKW